MPASARLQFTQRLLIAAVLSLLTACASTPTPQNVAITAPEPRDKLYRPKLSVGDDVGETLVMLSFSGGGTRAAALSYGVMQELRDTLVESNGKTVRVLDEIDTISSVSGGSFTAAYYGAFREDLFRSYETDFLRRNVQGDLIGSLFNPANWFRSGSRTDRAAEYYDKHIFRGATFEDIAQQGPPFIDINATDLSTGSRFTFTQELFDLICTDLGVYPLSRAVTASSAVPVAFPTVILKNHADQCDVNNTPHWQVLAAAEPATYAQEELVSSLKSYRDADRRPFIHLVDGGIADNLGLRAVVDRVEGLGAGGAKLLERSNIRNVLVILVNAEVHRDMQIDTSPTSPSGRTVVGATTAAQMNRYNQETLDSVRRNIAEYEATAQRANAPIGFYFAEVNFSRIKGERLSRIFNSLPTSLALDDEEVDWLIAAGRKLLREDPEFQRFKANNNAELVEGAMSNEDICRLSPTGDCNPNNL